MTTTSNATFNKTTEASTVAAAYPDSIRDRTILITGVNKSGIGFTTAEALASQSPRRLIFAGRSSSKLQECIDLLRPRYPNIDIRPLVVDLSSQRSIRDAASQVLNWAEVLKIHLLVNNAGIMHHGDSVEGPVPKNEEGIEQHFATNHIGHFLLTNLLMPKILAAAGKARPGSVRIVNLSSSGTFVSPLRASDIGWTTPASQLPKSEQPSFVGMRMAGMEVHEEMAYIPTAAYGHSKTCNILFSVGLNRRVFERYGVLSVALNPGEIRTELGRNTDSEWLARAIKRREEMGLMQWKTQKQGASTTVVAACDPGLSLPGDDGRGAYLQDCQIGQAPVFATDTEAAEKLWRISEALVGQEFLR